MPIRPAHSARPPMGHTCPNHRARSPRLATRHPSRGGTPFTTRRSTLCRVPDSALAKLFTLDNGFGEPDKDKSGAYFLNRNAKFFTWVHDYLLFECRLYDLPPADMIRSVRMEADFWGLKDLVYILDATFAQPGDLVLGPPEFSRPGICPRRRRNPGIRRVNL